MDSHDCIKNFPIHSDCHNEANEKMDLQSRLKNKSVGMQYCGAAR